MPDLACSSPQSTSSAGRASGTALDLLFGKTSPEHSAATRAETLQQWLTRYRVWTEPPSPPKGWGTEGAAVGPEAMVEWAVLDAQWFGVAQRRRRVFALADFGNWAGREPILLEPESLRGDSAPRREAGEGITQSVAPCLTSSGRGVERAGDTRGQDPIVAVPGGAVRRVAGCWWDGGQVSQTLDAVLHKGQTMPEKNRFPAVLIPPEGAQGALGPVSHALTAEGFDASEDGTGRGTPVVAFSCKDYGADAGPISPTLRSMGHDGSHANAGGQVAVAFAENSRAEVRIEGGDGQRTGAISTGGGKPGQGVPMVLQHPESDTLYNKGIATLKEGNASAQETYPGTLLRTLRQEVGEEAFAKWGLGILDSLQQAEVLRQALHGFSIRPAAFSRSWVVYCALSRSESRSGWLLQSLREAGCERCASQGWEPSEQLAGELGAYLSELSQPGAQAGRFMRDLWWAAQGAGLLRQALSAVQEVGRPAHGQRKPVHAGADGFGAAGAEGLQGAGLHREIPRDGVLQQACAASEAGNSGCSATEQERGGQSRLGQTPFAVRRLTCEEAELLQGFPRGYTKTPWRGKPASECPDGPRYKALGNSMAVPVIRWIGRRIELAVLFGE